MELSTSINVLFDIRDVLKVEHMIERLAGVGFKVLDFNFCDWIFEDSPFVTNGWEKWIKNAKKAADDLGVRFSQSHGPIFDKFSDSELGRTNTLLSHRSIEASAILGAKWVVFEPGHYCHDGSGNEKGRNLEWFGGILKTAEKVTVGIAIENITDYFSNKHITCRSYGSTPSELIDLTDTFNHPLIGICWDTGHANLQRVDQRKALGIIGNRLKVVHIQDNDRSSDQHLLPYCGNVNWKEIIDTLYEIGFKGDFTYEVASFTRSMPDSFRDIALRYAFALGQAMLQMHF